MRTAPKAGIGRPTHEQLIVAAAPQSTALRYGAAAGNKKNGGFRMRKLIIAATALAFIASPAFAQDKAGADKGAAPAASGTDASKDTMKKAPKKAKKSSAKKKSDDTMQKQ
jgi:hypothetical protein